MKDTDMTIFIFQFSDSFTQMIWQSTQKFGCGKARSRSGKVVVVAYYEPKGNIKGLFHENVFPPVFDKIDEDEIDFDPKKNTSINFCDNHWMYVLYVNVINIIIIVILVIVVI